MRKRSKYVVGGVVLLAMTLLVSTRVLSQEKAKPPVEDEMAEMMAKWKQLNAKGPEHEKFKGMVGSWETETRMWMAPQTPPMVSQGTAEFRLILDGRYIQQMYKCPMMGEAFEGLGIEGYDRVKQKYVSIWLDNSGTGIFLTEGTMDESGKVCTYHGKMDDPMTGQKDKVVKSVAREINKDKVVFEMYDTMPGVGEFKSMEITYTRKK